MRLVEAETIVLAIAYLAAAVPVGGILLAGRVSPLYRLPLDDVVRLVVAVRCPRCRVAARLDGHAVERRSFGPIADEAVAAEALAALRLPAVGAAS